jgi:hypothetical protein
MYRPTFPHTLDDITRSLDGGLGLVVADLPDQSIWVLKRDRKTGGFTMTHYDSPKRTKTLEQRHFERRQAAVDAMALAVGLSS